MAIGALLGLIIILAGVVLELLSRTAKLERRMAEVESDPRVVAFPTFRRRLD